MKLTELGLLSLGTLALAFAPLPSSLPILGTNAAVARGNGGDHGGGGGRGGGSGNAGGGQSGLAAFGNSRSHSNAAGASSQTGIMASELGGLNAYHALENGNPTNASPNSAVGMIQTYLADYKAWQNNPTTENANQLTTDLTALGAIDPKLRDANSPDGLNQTVVGDFNTTLTNAGLITTK